MSSPKYDNECHAGQLVWLARRGFSRSRNSLQKQRQRNVLSIGLSQNKRANSWVTKKSGYCKQRRSQVDRSAPELELLLLPSLQLPLAMQPLPVPSPLAPRVLAAARIRPRCCSLKDLVAPVALLLSCARKGSEVHATS